MRSRYLLLLFATFPVACFSQIENGDSISTVQNASDSISLESNGKPDGISTSMWPMEYQWRYSPERSALFTNVPAYPFNMPVYDYTTGQAGLYQWNSGEIIATGGATSFPGMMQIDSGTIGVYQSIGNFTFYAGGIVNKYGYFNGLYTQYGLNGSVTYQFSHGLSATIFGDYNFGTPPRMANGMLMPPSMIGYYERSKYGGYFDIQINERWGIQTGVQTVQQVGTNHFNAEPIVTPYYKINKKIAIGLPVGQILYHLLK